MFSSFNAYWRKLKQRLKEEGNETVTNCHGLNMLAPDGKMRLTYVADTELDFLIKVDTQIRLNSAIYCILKNIHMHCEGND